MIMIMSHRLTVHLKLELHSTGENMVHPEKESFFCNERMDDRNWILNFLKNICQGKMKGFKLHGGIFGNEGRFAKCDCDSVQTQEIVMFRS